MFSTWATSTIFRFLSRRVWPTKFWVAGNGQALPTSRAGRHSAFSIQGPAQFLLTMRAWEMELQAPARFPSWSEILGPTLPIFLFKAPDHSSLTPLHLRRQQA